MVNNKQSALEWSIAALIPMAGIGISIALTSIGEPQSAWLWCDILGLGICK